MCIDATENLFSIESVLMVALNIYSIIFADGSPIYLLHALQQSTFHTLKLNHVAVNKYYKYTYYYN